jgi:hypothetical protein
MRIAEARGTTTDGKGRREEFTTDFAEKTRITLKENRKKRK